MVGLAYYQAKNQNMIDLRKYEKTEFMLTLAHKMFTNAHTCH
jgi:hypothetical protein